MRAICVDFSSLTGISLISSFLAHVCVDIM